MPTSRRERPRLLSAAEEISPDDAHKHRERREKCRTIHSSKVPCIFRDTRG